MVVVLSIFELFFALNTFPQLGTIELSRASIFKQFECSAFLALTSLNIPGSQLVFTSYNYKFIVRFFFAQSHWIVFLFLNEILLLFAPVRKLSFVIENILIVWPMVLILNGISEHIALVYRKLSIFGQKYSICVCSRFNRMSYTDQTTEIVPYLRTYFVVTIEYKYHGLVL